MSVQSRRKPSKLLAATVWGLILAFPLGIFIFFVHGTVQEIRNQAVEGTACEYIALYILCLIIFVVGAFCRVRSVGASKGDYVKLQLVFFILFVIVFRIVLSVAGGGGTAFFLGNPEPGVFSTYEAFYIWLLCTFGLLLLTLSVMNDKYRNGIRIGVGGILFTISIFLPKALDSYELLRATCGSRALEEWYSEVRCPAEAIETIPQFPMAISFAVTLAVLFTLSIATSEVTHLSGARTGDGAQNQQNLPGEELETAVSPSSAEPLPPVAQRHSPCGSFPAAVLGGAVVWMIQAIGKRATKGR